VLNLGEVKWPRDKGQAYVGEKSTEIDTPVKGGVFRDYGGKG